jgi:hypothetical protein
LSSQFLTLVGGLLILLVQSLDLLQIIHVAFSEHIQFIFALVFLLGQNLILLHSLVHFLLHPLDLLSALSNRCSLAFKFCLQLAVLVTTLIEYRGLVVDLRPQSLNEPYVAVNSLSVLFLHQSLLFVQSAKCLF